MRQPFAPPKPTFAFHGLEEARNDRAGFPGGTDELTDFVGTYIPQPTTEEERQARNYPRPSIESLCSNKEEYLELAERAEN